MKRFVVQLSVLALVAGSVMALELHSALAPRADAATSQLVPGTTPHYYGPYANYANSPLHMSDAVVDFVGGGGSGAAAVATVSPSTGAITSFQVTDGGSGYSSTPAVQISSPVAGGTGASATAAISRGVTAISMTTPGSGYTQPPLVTISGDGSGATAAPNMSGFVGSIEVGQAGHGLTNPVVVIEPPADPTGVQATATATLDGAGAITAIVIVNRGSGYTTEPGVVITEGTQPVTAVAKAIITMDTISSIDVTATGSGYTTASVAIGAPPGVGTQASATAVISGAVTAVNVVSGGSGYVTAGGIKKFVDGLPGLGATNHNELGQYIPIAVPDTSTYPGSDYYEIGVVQYRERMSSSLPAVGTLLRGYVQLSTSVVPGARVQLTNANLNPLVSPLAINLPGGQPALGVDNPHQYGPFIQATKDRPVRILFRDLLPTGVAGDLFLPVDTTVGGSGMGGALGTPSAEPNPQSPRCDNDPKPAACYTENRASLHLHGGITPWISDGTPHQWITPATESTLYPKGVSVSNVPDMADPGPGAQTFFYTNQDSARLMFYHDHSAGITRLNVYAGESAGYTITDDTEKALVNSGTIPTTQIPLILADKTFVSDDGTASNSQIASEDPTWNAAKWGTTGNLWFPHVFMPAQNPSASTGSNPYGRWMYGPWFWPPTAGIDHPPIANPYYNPACNTDVTEFCEPPLNPATPNVSVGMEAFNDTPTVNGTAYPTTTVDPKSYRFRILNAADDRYFDLSLYQADSTGTSPGTEVALKSSEVQAALSDPTVAPTPDTTLSPPGPNMIDIGTEGGFLPAPVVVPPQPLTYVMDPARFDVGNVDKHALLIAPAERHDVIIDFSKYAGKTLILYNDAPAAFPARDARYDYYTGNPDLRDSGGAPSTMPGYGPNTRTVMQIKVAAAPIALPFNLSRLQTAFAHHTSAAGKPAGVFESSQNPIVVGQGAYNSAYGTSFRTTSPNDGFVRINDGSLSFKTLANGPTGASMTIPLQFKAMHDEQGAAFDPVYGRMSSELGVEDPAALTNAQNVYLYPYINPATEIFKGIELPPGVSVTPISSAADGTQIWKITHNGVDTHAIHFHLYNVQVLNRTGWDGVIRPPDPTELGWKDTVRVSPLEDTFVAMRPIIPKLPFGVPQSVRLLDPTMPEGSTVGFNQAGPGGAVGGVALNIVNTKVNMDWEYVWHCHMLSHEEMDMMRPVIVTVATTLPTAPVLSRTGTSSAFTWTDGTPLAGGFADWGSPSNEIGFRLERAPVVNGVTGSYTVISSTLANHTGFTDTTGVGGQTYKYRAVAYNASGDSISNIVTVTPPTFTLSGQIRTVLGATSGATVTVYTAAGANVGSSTTNSSGAYSVGSLNTGSYKLYIQPPSSLAGFVNQWFGASGATQATATVIAVSANTTQDVTLFGTPSFTLSGTLTTTGGPSPGVVLTSGRVSIYNAATSASVSTVQSNGVGFYTVALPAGTYKIYLQPNRTGYANQWFGGTSITNATVITISGNKTQNIQVHV
jgi:FtsP/CotA-like multicopper oxidase with cupredoxin domain